MLKRSPVDNKPPKAEIDIIVVDLGTLRLISGRISTGMRQMEMNVGIGSEVCCGASAPQAANASSETVLVVGVHAVDLPHCTFSFLRRTRRSGA